MYTTGWRSFGVSLSTEANISIIYYSHGTKNIVETLVNCAEECRNVKRLTSAVGSPWVTLLREISTHGSGNIIDHFSFHVHLHIVHAADMD